MGLLNVMKEHNMEINIIRIWRRYTEAGSWRRAKIKGDIKFLFV